MFPHVVDAHLLAVFGHGTTPARQVSDVSDTILRATGGVRGSTVTDGCEWNTGGNPAVRSENGVCSEPN